MAADDNSNSSFQRESKYMLNITGYHKRLVLRCTRNHEPPDLLSSGLLLLLLLLPPAGWLFVIGGDEDGV